MSKWKLFTGKNKDPLAPLPKSGSERFTPKRISPDQDVSVRFHNITLDKDRSNQSRFSEEKDKTVGRSLIGKALIIQQPRVMNTSFSEMKLTKNQHRPRKSLLSSASFILNIPQQCDSRTKRSQNEINRQDKDKQILIQRINEIKKQFVDFQKVVFNELKRQQKYINTMIDEIIMQIQQRQRQKKRMSQQTDYYLRNSQIEYMGKVMEKNSIEGERVIGKQQTKQKVRKFINGRKRQQLKIQICQDHYENGGICNVSQKVNSPSLNRLFSAMESLKKDVKGLNEISDISSIVSPKNTKSKFDWNNSLRVNR